MRLLHAAAVHCGVLRCTAVCGGALLVREAYARGVRCECGVAVAQAAPTPWPTPSQSGWWPLPPSKACLEVSVRGARARRLQPAVTRAFLATRVVCVVRGPVGASPFAVARRCSVFFPPLSLLCARPPPIPFPCCAPLPFPLLPLPFPRPSYAPAHGCVIGNVRRGVARLRGSFNHWLQQRTEAANAFEDHASSGGDAAEEGVEAEEAVATPVASAPRLSLSAFAGPGPVPEPPLDGDGPVGSFGKVPRPLAAGSPARSPGAWTDDVSLSDDDFLDRHCDEIVRRLGLSVGHAGGGAAADAGPARHVSSSAVVGGDSTGGAAGVPVPVPVPGAGARPLTWLKGKLFKGGARADADAEGPGALC
jgi:hypothetical protein